ncbi:MAG: M3 family metallopeptidase, partial [Candidatus Latescibacterota bacterium]
MRTCLLLLVVCIMLVTAVHSKDQNPFLDKFDTPFEVPPFDKIKVEHYMPAFEEAMARHNEQIDRIINHSAAPTFGNTIEALDYSGALLASVSNVFFSMNSALTNEEMQAIAKESAPMLSKHRDNIQLNDKLFQRIKAVYDNKDRLSLSREQEMLLDDTYKNFVRNGANLDEEKKNELKAINEELSVLTLTFGENILKENNAFELIIDSKEDLAGLPEAVVTGAAEDATRRGHEGKWVFTLHKPSMIPFIQFSAKRELREKIYKAYFNRGDNNNELDNKEILSKIASLRVKRAHLLGYKTHAHYMLEESMAKQPEEVYKLLNQLWTPALARAKMEAKELQAMIDAEGNGFKLASW